MTAARIATLEAQLAEADRRAEEGNAELAVLRTQLAEAIAQRDQATARQHRCPTCGFWVVWKRQSRGAK